MPSTFDSLNGRVAEPVQGRGLAWVFEVSQVCLCVGSALEADDDGVSIPQLVPPEIAWISSLIHLVVCLVIGHRNDWVPPAWCSCDGVLCRFGFGLSHAFGALPSWVCLL